jgi:hypothetical protein
MVCILLADGAGAREEEHRRAVRIRGPKRSSGFRSTKSSDLKFRALLTADNIQVLFYRKEFDRLGEASA